MKIRILLIPLICVLAAVLSVQAQDKGAKSTESETELETKMEEINAAYRKLNRQVKDSEKNADSLEQVSIIKQNATAALKLEPKMKAEISAADQAKFVADYQAGMKDFVANVAKLEAALKADKNEDAENMMKTLKQGQKDGHKQFKKKKK